MNKKWQVGQLVTVKKKYHALYPKDVDKYFVVKFDEVNDEFFLEYRFPGKPKYRLTNPSDSTFELAPREFFYEKVD